MAGIGSYLKKHTEALVKDVGIEAACELTASPRRRSGVIIPTMKSMRIALCPWMR